MRPYVVLALCLLSLVVCLAVPVEGLCGPFACSGDSCAVSSRRTDRPSNLRAWRLLPRLRCPGCR
jgi:hypothetical protein